MHLILTYSICLHQIQGLHGAGGRGQFQILFFFMKILTKPKGKMGNWNFEWSRPWWRLKKVKLNWWAPFTDTCCLLYLRSCQLIIAFSHTSLCENPTCCTISPPTLHTYRLCLPRATPRAWVKMTVTFSHCQLIIIWLHSALLTRRMQSPWFPKILSYTLWLM